MKSFYFVLFFSFCSSFLKADTLYIYNYKRSSVYDTTFEKVATYKFKRNKICIVRPFLHKNYYDSTISNLLIKQPYCKLFDKRGRLFEEGIWNGEYFDGLYKSYHKNGILKSSGRYQTGKKVGIWSYYDDSGKLISSINYG